MATKRIDPKSIDEQAILEIVAGKNERIGTLISETESSRRSASPVPPIQSVPQPTVSAERMAAYEREFLRGVTLSEHRSLHIDGKIHRRITALTGISGTQVTVSGFVNRVLEHHFREYGAEIMALLNRYYQSLKQP